MIKFNDIKVTYNDNTEVIVKPVSNENIDIFRECIEKIVKSFYLHDGAIRDVLAENEVLEAFESVCSIIPVKSVRGKDTEEKYLEWDKIKDNYEQLIVMFCNSSLKPDRTYDTVYRAGQIVQLNFIQITAWVSQASKQYEENMRALNKTDSE